MRHLTLTALAVLLLAGCTPLAQPVPPAGHALAGREFWSTAIQGRALVPATRIALAFNQDGTLGAGAGCNSMGGTWSLDGATLRVAIGQMTEMGCPDDRFAQDDWLIDWLTSGLTATTEGDGLILTGRGVTLTLLDHEIAERDVAEVERMMTEVLQSAVRVEIDGPRLRLHGPAAGLMFVAE